ncbi:IS1634 family transposase [Persicobacter psychrovividus]|uniref:IS1634 family transposase n=1 Tax=Persicobacter psychrovividus TaxID=387638 RepID=A0ABM7VMG5_9BACT|nr:IS1634 family transposase [Persicobacter psychrovividus]
MFVREKLNKSGSISVQVIYKSSKKYKVVKTFGSSADPNEILALKNEANRWIHGQTGQVAINFDNQRTKTQQVLDKIDQVKSVGIDLLLNSIYDEIGFNLVGDLLFRRLVFSRIEYPVSKLATTEHWSLNHGMNVSVNTVYRLMDKVHSEYKEILQHLSFEHSKQVLEGEVNIAFYDVTTLYFETDHQDDLRKTGFSKEGKHQNPQIVLGLLVSRGGYPLAYEIFEGNKFEGHTMLPIVDEFCNKYNITKLVVVADSGLMSNKNVKELLNKGYGFILGARIKNMNKEVKDQILNLTLGNGESAEIAQPDGLRLIITYSDKRAKKDGKNRQKGLDKLKKNIASGKLTKSNINNRGYNKYLKLDGEVKVQLDEEKFKEDGKWDGLKGYLTNVEGNSDEIIANYGELWKIEKAFRISKTDLKIRPIFHRIQKRIESHICISFVAYNLHKELERQLNIKEAGLSPEQTIKIARSIYEIQVPLSDGSKINKVLLLQPEQVKLAELFNF